jgi:mannose-6-phosphate isomerase-like protein (cupin superfamily)
MNPQPIVFAEKLSRFAEHWSPRVIAELTSNVPAGATQLTHQFKLAKFQGEFVWHQHDDTDEVFVVLAGRLTIEFRDGAVTFAEGEMRVVPRGTPHRPVAGAECHVLLIEPRGVVNTGEAGGAYTAANDVWI